MAPAPAGRNVNSRLAEAPPSGLAFPETANMTVAELIAFLPNSLKCVDIVYRFASNGGTRKALFAMANTFRHFNTQWEGNCIGSVIHRTMEAAGFKGWTITKHSNWPLVPEWNHENLCVGGYAPSGPPSGNIPFKSLAVSVRKMPEGDDALDLTRMVTYCVENPDQKWQYPKDYEMLLGWLGGPAVPNEKHIDRLVFERWHQIIPPPPTASPQGDSFHGNKPVDKLSDVCNGKAAGATFQTLGLASVPNSLTLPNEQGTLQRPRKRAKLDDESITSPSLGSVVNAHPPADCKSSDIEDDRESFDSGVVSPFCKYAKKASNFCGEEYSAAEKPPMTKSQPVYVEPPYNAQPPNETILLIAWELGHSADSACDPYHAYAFNGPRCQPPYRLLENISQPNPLDISIWGENLRWALEQRVLFAHMGTKWNESPEHMKVITKARIDSLWVSDELISSRRLR